jgi:hypothetical protein
MTTQDDSDVEITKIFKATIINMFWSKVKNYEHSVSKWLKQNLSKMNQMGTTELKIQ